MKIFLPNSAYLRNIDSFLKTLNLDSPGELLVDFHKKWVSVHPVVLAAVGALALKAKRDGASIKVSEVTAASKNYFKRMGLLEWLDIGHDIIFHENEKVGRFIPLRQIKTSDDLAEFLEEITPLLHTGAGEAESIRYVMSELIRNVLEHSKSNIGAVVCAQYYKKSSRVSIGIADCGVGILDSISKNHEVRTHLDAIQLALKPGITGTTNKLGGTESNAGAGLFFTRGIAKASSEYFVIYSGNSFFKQRIVAQSDKKQLQLFLDAFTENNTKSDTLPE